MVGLPRDVEEIYFGGGGILSQARPGTFLIDMTTSSPSLAKRIASAAAAKRLRALLVPYGKVGHDAFAVIRETIREMDKVAIGRLVLTNREHIVALEPLDRGLMGTLLRYPYEVRSADEYFDEIQDVKVTKDMLDLAKHIVNQKSGRFEPDKFEDQYETALVDLINQKRSGKPIVPKERPRGENVVDLMEALRKSVGGAGSESKGLKKGAKKPRKAAAGQKEMLMPIAGKKPAKETAAKKPTAKPQRKSA
jgi:DNA end-binding protein Ku